MKIDFTKKEDCIYYLKQYIKSKDETMFNTASGKDKQIILKAIQGLEIDNSQIIPLLAALGETQKCNYFIVDPNADLLLNVLKALKNDHRSLLLHYGSTESYKIAIKFLKSILANDYSKNITGKGMGKCFTDSFDYKVDTKRNELRNGAVEVCLKLMVLNL